MSKWLAIAIHANIHANIQANIQAYIPANVCAIAVHTIGVDISRRGNVVVQLLTLKGFQKANINNINQSPHW